MVFGYLQIKDKDNNNMNMHVTEKEELLLQLTDQDRAWLMMCGLQFLFDRGMANFKGRNLKEVAEEIIGNAEEE